MKTLNLRYMTHVSFMFVCECVCVCVCVRVRVRVCVCVCVWMKEDYIFHLSSRASVIPFASISYSTLLFGFISFTIHMASHALEYRISHTTYKTLIILPT